MKLTIAILASLVATIFAAPTHASNYPGERAVRSPALDTIIERGLTFWQDRGVDVAAACPDRIATSVANDLRDVDQGDGPMAGYIAGRGANCELTLIAADLSRTLRQLHRSRDVWWTRGAVEETCLITWHEVGHALGLDHTAVDGAVHFYAEWVTDPPRPNGTFDGHYVEPHQMITDEQAVRLMRASAVFTPPGCKHLSRQLARRSGVYTRAARHARHRQAKQYHPGP